MDLSSWVFNTPWWEGTDMRPLLADTLPEAGFCGKRVVSLLGLLFSELGPPHYFS